MNFRERPIGQIHTVVQTVPVVSYPGVSPHACRRLETPNPRMVYRGRELFNKKRGLAFYDGELHKRYVDEQALPPAPELPYPDAGRQIFRQVRAGQSLLVDGDHDSGKSTAMYTIRQLMRDDRHPYVLYDGHFTRTDPRKIASAIQWAQTHDAAVLWDSFDYLTSDTWRIRKLAGEERQLRSRFLLERLSEFIEQGGVFVGTQHGERWFRENGDPEIINGPWRDFVSKLHVHHLTR